MIENSVENKPVVSVIMPSLNVAKYIDKCIQSVMGQTMQNIEIICIDAGSTDGTWEKLQEYELTDERIRLIHSDKKSYGYQVNLGIANSHGKYIAIVETDDFVQSDMFEALYNLAEKYSLDYAKGAFYAFENEADEASFQKAISHKIVKNRVIEPSKYMGVYLEDNSIWTGLYSRDFLKDNEIKLNETQGAAYQDIGFLMQTITKAKRVLYIDDCLYNYRTSRAESSSYSDDIAKYVYQEFDWLFHTIKMDKTEGLYLRLAEAALCEITKLLKKNNYEGSPSWIKYYYDFFKEELENAISSGRLTSQFFDILNWTELNLYLDNWDAFVAYKRAQGIIEEQKERELLSWAKGSDSIIIFGAGVYGKKVYEKLERVDVVAFTDNNKVKWNQSMCGKEILEFRDCLDRFPNAKYVIANKNYWYEMSLQLIENGVENYYIWK